MFCMQDHPILLSTVLEQALVHKPCMQILKYAGIGAIFMILHASVRLLSGRRGWLTTAPLSATAVLNSAES